MAKKKARSVDTRESVRVVTHNSYITCYGTDRLSLKARKLLYIALSQVKQDDKEFFEYRLTPLEFAVVMGIDVSNVYDEAEAITDELMKLEIRVYSDDKGKKGFKKIHVFDECDYTDDSDIVFWLNKKMTTLLLGLHKDFSKPLLHDFMKMKSPYSMAVWHLMQREMKSAKPNHTQVIEFELSIQELRQVTGTEDKLPQMVHFKERVLDKAIKEIGDLCGVAITYDNLKSGRVITGFHFYARNIYGFDINELDPFFVERVEERAKELNK